MDNTSLSLRFTQHNAHHLLPVPTQANQLISICLGQDILCGVDIVFQRKKEADVSEYQRQHALICTAVADEHYRTAFTSIEFPHKLHEWEESGAYIIEALAALKPHVPVVIVPLAEEKAILLPAIIVRPPFADTCIVLPESGRNFVWDTQLVGQDFSRLHSAQERTCVDGDALFTC